MPAKIARTLVNTIKITGWEDLHLEIINSLELEEVYLLASGEVMDEASIFGTE